MEGGGARRETVEILGCGGGVGRHCSKGGVDQLCWCRRKEAQYWVMVCARILASKVVMSLHVGSLG